MENKVETTQVKTAEVPKKRNKTFIIVLALLIIISAWFGISKYVTSQHHAETDDAQVEANISPVIPRISGYVMDVRVRDNQAVKKGDTVMVLDDRELRLKVEQAEAALATAQSSLGAARATTNAATAGIATSRANVSTIDAQIEAARVSVWRTTQDFNRYANLIQDHSITQQQYEQAVAAKETAEKQLQVLHQQKKQAYVHTNVVAEQSTATGSQISIAAATIKQRQVDVENAKLNLSYAVVTAPEDGLVSKVNVQAGQFLQAGQPVFSIVHNDDVWVVANFKETQFHKMKVGQNVVVHADAFPGHDFSARLTSFSPATGSQISIAAATIKQRQVDVENAKLNLSYAVVTAPEDGLVSKVNVQAGQFLQAGQPVFSIVHNDDVWVVANFKETQFHKMKVGQNVVVHADAFPGHDFSARLTSFSPATGARFALLPPDNASGNFVKVVQRLPVKIEFVKQDSLVKQLRPGMNVTADVNL